MKFVEFFDRPDINKELERFDNSPQALLVDVRTPQEYSEGHIPCSVNIPVYELYKIEERPEGKETPVYVYCHSGARSRSAATMLRAMGYRHAHNIGGISDYLGRIEQSSDNVVFLGMQALYSGV